MEKLERLTTQQRANLTAYLDGELDEGESRAIEHLLAISPVARNEVEVLTRTWEMLDLLPRHGAGQDFTEKTLETIRLDEYREPLSEKPWFQTMMRGAVAAAWAAGLLLAAVLGYLSTNRFLPNETENLVRELPLIENLDVYQQVDNIDFVRNLEQSGLFNEEEVEETDTEKPANDEPQQDE